MKLTIHGPNLYDQSKGSFHVHTAECRDNAREVRRNGSEHPWTIEAASVADAVLAVYSDHLGEAERETEWHRANGQPDYPAPSWRDYADDLHFAPCIKGLPEEVTA
jgi:hypothetical protein